MDGWYDNISFIFERFWDVLAWCSLSWSCSKKWHMTGCVLGFAWLILQCELMLLFSGTSLVKTVTCVDAPY